MTEREKIIEAINSVQAYGIMSNAFGGDLPVTNEMLADTLIEAGIGDRRNHRLFISEDGTEVKQLYNDEEVEQIARERDEYKRRAEVAELALFYAASDYRCDECPCEECNVAIRGSNECIDLITKTYREQAEKTIAEEENND